MTLGGFNDTQRRFFRYANLAIPTDEMRSEWNRRVGAIHAVLEQQFGQPMDDVYREVDQSAELCQEAGRLKAELDKFLDQHKVAWLI